MGLLYYNYVILASVYISQYQLLVITRAPIDLESRDSDSQDPSVFAELKVLPVLCFAYCLAVISTDLLSRHQLLYRPWQLLLLSFLFLEHQGGLRQSVYSNRHINM